MHEFDARPSKFQSREVAAHESARPRNIESKTRRVVKPSPNSPFEIPPSVTSEVDITERTNRKRRRQHRSHHPSAANAQVPRRRRRERGRRRGRGRGRRRGRRRERGQRRRQKRIRVRLHGHCSDHRKSSRRSRTRGIHHLPCRDHPIMNDLNRRSKQAVFMHHANAHDPVCVGRLRGDPSRVMRTRYERRPKRIRIRTLRRRHVDKRQRRVVSTRRTRHKTDRKHDRADTNANQPASPGSASPARSAAVFVETERALRRGEEPYSCTVTTPDAAIAKGSAKNAALLSGCSRGREKAISRRPPCSRPFCARTLRLDHARLFPP